MTGRSQSAGFALLLMMFVLMGVGITGLSQTHGHRVGSGPAFNNDQYALQTARQALLTYATLYPWLYGPRGAGPGHLPCPDTDASTMAPWSRSSSRDGPNPPCGSERSATGQLPRHVNFPGHRYAFHVDPFQRLQYRVSSGMINNPVNRVVNDAVIKGDQEQSPFVAWISQPADDEYQLQSTTLQVPVSRESLLPAIRLSVVAWLLRQVNHERAEACSSSAESLISSANESIPDVLSIIAQQSPEAVSQPSSQPASIVDACLHAQEQGVADEERLIEGVPVAAHWFVRNRWHERVVIQSSESCAMEPAANCLLVWDSSEAERSDGRLYFSWQTRS